MAMEKQYMIRETHTRPLTTVGFNPARREILVGCEGRFLLLLLLLSVKDGLCQGVASPAIMCI